MRTIFFVLAAVIISGCSRQQYLRQYTAERTDCPVQMITITKEDGSTAFSHEWSASGCGSEYDCRSDTSGISCEESEQSKYAKLKAAQRESKSELQCAAKDVQIIPKKQGKWAVEGCDRELLCARIDNQTRCEETEASKQRTYRKVVVDRLALETSCPREQVLIEQQADWTRGTETAYRMTACGKAYICTTAAGRTECKAALAVQQP